MTGFGYFIWSWDYKESEVRDFGFFEQSHPTLLNWDAVRWLNNRRTNIELCIVVLLS